MSNSSDGSFDLVGGGPTPPADSGLHYVSTGRKSKKDKKRKSEKRRKSEIRAGDINNGISPNSATSTDVFDYGSQYILPPQPEEQMSLVSSDNLDPLDPLAGKADSFRDEFEDEMDEIEMDKRQNFNQFGDRSRPKTRSSNLKKGIVTYLIPALIGILFLLGIVAAILYVAGVGKSDSKTVMVVPAAPETLSLMCDVSAQGGVTPDKDVPGLCKTNCLQAECCWNPSGKFVCSDETNKQCPSYQVECNPWKPQLTGTNNNNKEDLGEMAVPEFPAGLQTACEPTFADADSQDCISGCAAADCCWNKLSKTICTGNSVHNCLNYNEVCSFLNDHLGPDGEPVLDGTGNSGGGSSTTGGAVEKNWPFPDAPEGLSVYCDPAEMEEISLHICEDKCDDAECCWKNGVDSCVSQYAPQACRAYTQACGILNQLKTAPDNTHDITAATPPPATAESNTNTLPDAPANLATICSKTTIADNDTGGEALIQCEQACLKASCCWQPNAASPCPQNTKCAAYGSCDIFANLFDKPQDYDPNQETLSPITVSQVPAAPDGIDQTCRSDVLKTSVEAGKFIVECEKECLMGACCWKKNHPTKCPDAQECSAYQTPCGTNLVNALIALEGGIAGGSPPATPATTAPAPPAPAPAPAPTRPVETNVPEAPDDIAMMCNPEVLKLTVSDGDFIIQCEKECLEAACCWKENHATVCPDAPQCDEYLVPCGEHLLPVLETMEAGQSNAGNGASTPSNSQIDIPNAPDDMNLRCSLANLNTNPDGRGFCEESCAKAKCCWENGGAAMPACASNPVCQEYQLCENLLTTTPIGGSNGGNAPPTPPANLGTICAADAILDMSFFEQCKVHCGDADCCWLDDGDANTCTTSVECRTYETECELMRNMMNAAGGGSRRLLRHQG